MVKSIIMSTKISKSCQSNDYKWDKAIVDAQSEIDILTKRRRQLEQAVRIFKANKRDGVPWPEEEKSPATRNTATNEKAHSVSGPVGVEE